MDKFPHIAKTLKLTTHEESFAYLLICKNTSQNLEVQSYFEKILSRIRHEYVAANESEPPRTQTSEKYLYMDPLNSMLKSAVRIKGFCEEPSWIRENLLVPELTDERIFRSLKTLEELGAITRDPATGHLVGKAGTLWRPDPFDPTGQTVYTEIAKQMAELMRTPGLYKPSVYSGMSLAFDEAHLKEAERVMIETHHRLNKLSAECTEPTALVFIANYMLTILRLREKQ